MMCWYYICLDICFMYFIYFYSFTCLNPSSAVSKCVSLRKLLNLSVLRRVTEIVGITEDKPGLETEAERTQGEERGKTENEKNGDPLRETEGERHREKDVIRQRKRDKEGERGGEARPVAGPEKRGADRGLCQRMALLISARAHSSAAVPCLLL